MVRGKLIVICQSGGKFTAASDGSLSYTGGDAHAITVTSDSTIDELKSEVAEMWNYDPDSLTIKYFVPNNKKTLITISSNKDVQRMLDFHEDCATVDVYVMTDKNATNDVSVMPCSRSSRTTVAECVTPVYADPVASVSGDAMQLDTTLTQAASNGGDTGQLDIINAADSDARDTGQLNIINAADSDARDTGQLNIINAADSDARNTGQLNIFNAADSDARNTGQLKIFNAADSDARNTGQLNAIPLASSAVGEARQQKLLKSWMNCITGVQQQFKTVHEFRDALRKYSIAHGFLYSYKKNEGARVTANCKAEGCPWRIHASRVSTTQLFRIRKMNGTHTCRGTDAANRPHASRKLLACLMKEKLLDSPKLKPREIAEEIRQDFGIELKYTQAWRGIEIAKEELQGSCKESYNQLPWLCQKIVETNPGSVVTLITKEDLSFHRLFVAMHASLCGFQTGCRPLIFLDSLTLQSKYQSEVLTATGLDGNDGIFPIAFAIVDVANEDNWHWFLMQLKSALATGQPITFVADRKLGLRRSIPMIFENSYHGYCIRHLIEELKRDLKGSCAEETVDAVVGHLYEATHAITLDGFRKSVENMRNISSEACDWVLRSEPEHWANALFEGSRYDHVTSDIAEPFYSWLVELPVLPVVEIVDTMRRKIMELMYTCRVESNQWLTRLTPFLEDKLQKEILKAHSLQVLLGPTTYEVHDFVGAVYLVNIEIWACSCRSWQMYGYPCFHAVAVLYHIDKNLYDYCFKYYTTEAYRLTYAEPINPVPTTDKPVHRESTPVEVYPPPLRYATGPPKKRRIRNKGKQKRPLHCSKCKGVGHNRATCHIYS